MKNGLINICGSMAYKISAIKREKKVLENKK